MSEEAATPDKMIPYNIYDRKTDLIPNINFNFAPPCLTLRAGSKAPLVASKIKATPQI